MIKYITFTLLLLLHFYPNAQDGILDPSFDMDGIVRLMSGNNNTIIIKSVTVQPDQKIIAAGYHSNSIIDKFCLVRYNTDGSIDNSFGTNGIVITSFAYTSIASDIALQQDGKIVVAGHTWGGSSNEFAIARYLSDGSLDPNFGNVGLINTSFLGKNAIARSLVIQTDGKIVVAGHTYVLNNDFDEFALARYHADGSLDSNFGIGGKIETSFGAGTKNWINSIQLQNDGKIIASGFSDHSFALARYNSNGILDASFGISGLVTTYIPNSQLALINSMSIHSDGSIFGAGFSNNNYNNATIAKYDTSGNLDTTFGNNGILITNLNTQHNGLNDLTIQPDNKLLVGGVLFNKGASKFALARFDLQGNPDPSFGTNGVVTTAIDLNYNDLRSIALQADGKIVAAGCSGNPCDMTITRYTSTLLSTIHQVKSLENILISPNPTTGLFTIDLLSKTDHEITIQLFNIHGQLIQPSIEYTLFPTNNSKTISLNKYPSGIYYLSIRTSQEQQTYKVIKQ